ncbi:MAG: hypothetical protein R3314_04880 [Longimicrobiales bacterium]|nr:hypothetical protein [Longimicrobiales bacterium]
MTEPDRAEAMARRLARTADRLGMEPDGRALVVDAFRTAMEPRRQIEEDHHPDYLHPARTALILMDDTGESDPVTLAAAIFTETRDPALGAPARERARVSPEAASLADAIPAADAGDRLLESLLALPTPGARIAAAERLDHVRHLHLRDKGEWQPWHATTREAYVPVARRVDTVLAARLDWWCDMFRSRYLSGPDGGLHEP